MLHCWFRDAGKENGILHDTSLLIYSLSTQVKLLKSLGLRSTLITDGSNPINLFNTANGLLGALGAPSISDPNED